MTYKMILTMMMNLLLLRNLKSYLTRLITFICFMVSLIGDEKENCVKSFKRLRIEDRR